MHLKQCYHQINKKLSKQITSLKPKQILNQLQKHLTQLSILLALIIYLAVPLLAVYVRRLHDVGWSACWIVIHYALICSIYAIGVFHVVQYTILYGEDIHYILQNVYEQMQPILHYAAKPMEILSAILFIVTLLPGNPKKNKYGEPV